MFVCIVADRGSAPPSVADVDLQAQCGTQQRDPDSSEHPESSGKVVIHYNQ